MFINKIDIVNKDNNTGYPYNIPVIENFKTMSLAKPVTFFTGDNGSGKSTLIEAIAISMGINPEGGSQNFCFKTKDDYSPLYKDLIIQKDFEKPCTKYFLRAESFYNVANELDRLVEEDDNQVALIAHGGKSLHNESHGESFMQLIQNRFYDNGLYILDEPEAALSPQRQLSLLVLIDDLVKNGAQFIIATHSPILLAYVNSEIYQFSNVIKKTNYKDTETYELYKLFINEPELVLNKLLDK